MGGLTAHPFTMAHINITQDQFYYQIQFKEEPIMGFKFHKAHNHLDEICEIGDKLTTVYNSKLSSHQKELDDKEVCLLIAKEWFKH